MTKLSPAAQAVLNAAHDGANQVLFDVGDDSPVRSCAAAALRAAVAHTQVHHGHDVWECDADELLAIAAELKAHD